MSSRVIVEQTSMNPRYGKRRRLKWTLAAFAAAAVGLLAVNGAGAGFGFCSTCLGPSVRVVEVGGADGLEHTIVKIRWVAYQWGPGDAKVELFDNPDGTGAPIATAVAD